MSIIKISIDRDGEQKYEAQLDCTKRDKDNNNIGDKEDLIAAILLDTITSVFHSEDCLFGIYDVLVKCLYLYDPPYHYFSETGAKSITKFFKVLNTAWDEYANDDKDFIKYFEDCMKKENNG